MSGVSAVAPLRNKQGLQNWVGSIPSQFNMVNGQDFVSAPSGFSPPTWGWDKGQALFGGNTVTVTGGFVDPDGSTTAAKMVDIDVAGVPFNHVVAAGNTLSSDSTAAAHIPWRFCVIAKAAEYTRIVLQINDRGNAEQASAGFDLAGGNVGYDNSATGGWTIQAATMTQNFPIGNGAGWYLCTLDCTTTTANFNSWDARIYNDNGTGTAARSISYIGNPTKGVMLWFASFLPKPAWSMFTNEVFHDDFNDLSTIDVNDTRASGFNWYTHRTWPNNAQAGPSGTCFGGPPTPSSNISVASSILTLVADSGNCGEGIESCCSDPNDATQIIGRTFSPPFIYEAKMVYDASIEQASPPNDYHGSHPAIWTISTDLLLSALPGHNKAAEIDLIDGALFNALAFNAADSTTLVPSVPNHYATSDLYGNISSSTIYHRWSAMVFAVSSATNNFGFAIPFWDGGFSNQTMSSKWTAGAVIDTSQFMLILGAGSGFVAPLNTPTNIPINIDYIRILQ